MGFVQEYEVFSPMSYCFESLLRSRKDPIISLQGRFFQSILPNQTAVVAQFRQNVLLDLHAVALDQFVGMTVHDLHALQFYFPVHHSVELVSLAEQYRFAFVVVVAVAVAAVVAVVAFCHRNDKPIQAAKIKSKNSVMAHPISDNYIFYKKG